MTLPIYHDVSMQHLDQVSRETEAAVSEGLIGERDAVWIRSALAVVRADVKHAVERAEQPLASDRPGHARQGTPAPRKPAPLRSLGSEDTLVLPRGDEA